MGENFHDAKPVPAGYDPAIDEPINDDLTLYDIQKLLYMVQERQEWAVRRMSQLIDEQMEAEEAWLDHESQQLLIIKERLDDPENKEKTSDKIRHAECVAALNEEGTKGLKLFMKYRRAEDIVKNADRYCKMLDKRGSLLQTINGNLRTAT